MFVGNVSPRWISRTRIRALTRAVAPMVAALFLASCAGDGTFLDQTGRPLASPEIEVDRESVDVSLLAGTTQTVQIGVSNGGGLPLILEDVSVDAAFLQAGLSASALRGTTVGSGESVSIPVVVTAGDTDGTRTGTLSIRSNDPEHPVVTVAFQAVVTLLPVPEIDVAPTTINLVLVEGESGTRSFTVSNLGSAPLAVTVSTSAAFLAPLTTSATVAAGDSVVVDVDVDASMLPAGMFTGTVQVASDDADEPLVNVDVQLTVTPAVTLIQLSALQSAIFTPRCAESGCHDNASASAGLSLQAGFTWDNVVGVGANETVGTVSRVEPGSPDDSYLYLKIIEDPSGRILDRMPIIGLPLSDQEIADIRDWILQGAMDN